MPAPLRDDGQTHQELILRQINFTETIAEQGSSCTIHRDCPQGFCKNRCQYVRTQEFGECSNVLGWGVNTLGRCVQVNGCECDERCDDRVFQNQQDCEQYCIKACYRHDDPELRAVGSTPIGQSLFYAGEYFRHFVIKEGLSCTQDADCESPDYLCLEGQCHDPLGRCRPNVIVIVSDGYETDHEDPDDFFNPRIQAKRFHYGLGCEDDSQCFNGAQCVNQRCLSSTLPLEQTVCRGTGASCSQDAECPPYTCGLGMECPGECIQAGFHYIHEGGQNRIFNEAGHPIALTIHMIDVSGGQQGSSLIVQAGGGMVFDVDLSDPELLVDRLTTLINSKADDTLCR